MTVLRHQLRLIAATWLVFQAAWLAALVPVDCCAAHQPAEKSCHESLSATMCPMHGAHTEHATPASTNCRMTGSCDGPMAAFFALLSNYGILPDTSAVTPSVEIRRAAIVLHDRIGEQFRPPDSPPPRA